MDTVLSITTIGTSFALARSRCSRCRPGGTEPAYSAYAPRGVNCVGVVIDHELIPEFRFREGLYPYHHEDFIAWLSLIQRGYTGYRLPADLGRYRLSKGSLGANKFAAARRAWRIYRDLSNLPFLRAVSWWTQYAWNSYWLRHHARPRENNLVNSSSHMLPQ